MFHREDYFCEICDEHINIKSKSKHIKSKSQKEISKCDYFIHSLKDVDFDGIDQAYSLYMIEHNKKYEYCKINCQFKLVFDDGQHTEYITARLFDNRTRIWWKKF